MDQLDQYDWTIIYTDHNKQFIHLDHLKKSNPNSQILLADTSNKYSKQFAWKNGDLLVREWLKNNIDLIKYNNIAILEWDVLVSCQLPNLHICGLVGRDRINYAKNHGWVWFKEIDLLEEYKQYAIGVAPFGVLFIDKKSIEIILDKEFDKLYKKNLQAELRLPTVLNSRQVEINGYHMPNVSFLPVPYSTEPGIYHPIKTKIA